MHEPDPPLEFPPLFDFDADRWQWPAPPIGWRHEAAVDADTPQPCRVETVTGDTIAGEMLSFDLPGHSLVFRSAVNGLRVPLPFDQLLRLTLSLPLRPAHGRDDGPLDRLPLAEHECEYELQPRSHGAALTGRTVGHVETPEGLFLFAPVDNETALLRQFAPKGPIAGGRFHPTAMDIASRQWADSPATLVDAIEQQRRRPVAALGKSILALAFLTPKQLERALTQQPDDQPMGEFLVSLGLISQADLRAAIAHKMGGPVVDLKRFPIVPAALSTLPQRLAMSYRVLPLMLDDDRLMLASSEPPSEDKLRSIQVFTNLTPVPVLARAADLRATLAAVPSNAWSARVI